MMKNPSPVPHNVSLEGPGGINQHGPTVSKGGASEVQAKLKAGNIEGIAVNAETMALNSEHIPMLFPEGSLTEKSKAKPEIWQKRPEFESAAKNMGQWAVKLRDTARTKDAAATEAIMKDFGRQGCGTCHTPFRVPPPQQPAPPRS